MFTSAHPSLVQHDTEKRTVNLQPAAVLDESQLSELVHEKVDAAMDAVERRLARIERARGASASRFSLELKS